MEHGHGQIALSLTAGLRSRDKCPADIRHAIYADIIFPFLPTIRRRSRTSLVSGLACGRAAALAVIGFADRAIPIRKFPANRYRRDIQIKTLPRKVWRTRKRERTDARERRRTDARIVPENPIESHKIDLPSSISPTRRDTNCKSGRRLSD